MSVSGAVLCAVVGLLVFSNGLWGDYSFDDNFAIVYNSDSRCPPMNNTSPLSECWEPSKIVSIFYNDYWGQDISLPDSHKSYRPFTNLSFRFSGFLHRVAIRLEDDPTFPEVSKWVAAQPEVFWFHIINVLQHSLCCFLVCFVVKKSLDLFPFLAKDSPKDSSLFAFVSSSSFQATLVGFLFAIHPVHTEAITGIVGRAEGQSCIFLLLSVLALFKAIQSSNNEKSSLVTRLFFCTFWTVLVCLSISVATLSKETAFTGFGIFVVLELLILSLATPEEKDQKKDKKAAASIKRPFSVFLFVFYRLFLILSVAFFYLYMRTKITVSFTLSNYRELENPMSWMTFQESTILPAEMPLETRIVLQLFSIAYVHFRYLQLLFVPDPLSADWSHNCIPMISSLEDPRIPFIIAGYSAFLIISIYLGLKLLISAYSPKSSDNVHSFRYIIVGLSFLVLTFLPASNLFFFVGTLIGERLLYIPSIGFLMLIVWATIKLPDIISKITKGAVPRSAVLVFFLLILSAHSAWSVQKTLERNQVWENEEKLFIDALRVCPNSAKVQMNYGILRRRYDDYETSLVHFKKAKEIWPPYCEVDYWTGASLVNLGRFQEAIDILKDNLECKYSRLKSFEVLNLLFQGRIKDSPDDTAVSAEWAEVLGKGGFHREGFSLAFRIGMTEISKIEKTVLEKKKRKIFDLAAYNLKNAVTFAALFKEDEHNKEFDYTVPLHDLGDRSFNDAVCEATFLLAKSLQETDHTNIAAELYATTALDKNCSDMIKKLANMALVEILNENPYDPLLQDLWAQSLEVQERYEEAAAHFKASAMLYLNIVFAEDAKQEIKDDQRLAILDHAIGCLNNSYRLNPIEEVRDILATVKQRSLLLLERTQTSTA